MKKFLAGFVAGAVLFGGAAAYAGPISGLLGAKVSGVYTVKDANGKKIADAAIINDKAYAPVRAVSEAAGVSLKVEGKTITVNSSQDESNAKLTFEYQLQKASLEDYQNALSVVQKSYNDEMALPETSRLPGRAEQLSKVIADYTAKIADLKAKIADLERQLGITQ